MVIFFKARFFQRNDNITVKFTAELSALTKVRFLKNISLFFFSVTLRTYLCMCSDFLKKDSFITCEKNGKPGNVFSLHRFLKSCKKIFCRPALRNINFCISSLINVRSFIIRLGSCLSKKNIAKFHPWQRSLHFPL